MKVAIIIDTWFPFVGGGQINCWEISKRLAKKEVKIDIITRNNGKDGLLLPRNLKVIKLGPKSPLNSLKSRVIFCIKSFLFIYKKNYDLIHAHAFLPGLTIWLLKLFKRAPVIFTVHGVTFNTDLNNFIMRQIEKIILTKFLYDEQITVSRDFLKIKNINKKVTYIPNGIDLSQFDKIESQKFEPTVLLFVGRLHKQKNLKTLLLVFSIIKKELPKLKLIIAGDGPERSEIKNLINKLKLSKVISLKGEVTGTKLIKLYKSCHLFILPSIYEGQPLTILEAWAAKLPVIVTRSGDCQYLIKNSHNGYLIDNPKSPSEIAKIIKVAISNQNLEKLGQAGYNLVKQFTWESSAEKTLQVYKNVIKSKN